jgi:hypothetical protein
VAAAAGLGDGLGVLMGWLEDCGAGPDAEGGDARRPCCGHAARIRRLRRGARVYGAGDHGAGEKGAPARAVTPGCRGAGRRAGRADDASERGHGGRERGKGGRDGYGPVSRSGAAGGVSGGQVAGDCRRKGKTDGRVPRVSCLSGKVKGRVSG